MTGAVAFARYADLFSADYPRPGLSGTMTIEPGRYAAVRFDAGGGVSARRTLTVRRALTTRVTRRTRLVPGGELYLRLAEARPGAGGWPSGRGGCTRTRRRRCASTTPSEPWCCSPDGATRPCKLGKDGKVEASVMVRPDGPATLAVNAGATVLGYPCVRIADGDHAKYWLRLGAGAELR